MTADDLERITRLVLRDLGAGEVKVTAAPGPPGRWRVDVAGDDPVVLTIRAGAGTAPQYIREQIVAQFVNR